MKKLGLIILMLALTTAMAACQSGGQKSANVSGSGSGGSGGDGSSANTSGKSASAPKKVTFTYFNAGTNLKERDSDTTAIGKELEKQTGVNWKMQYLVGDINEKIGTMIAGGKYPDVMDADSAVDKVLGAHAFIPLNKLIDKYGPNIKKVYGPYFNQMKDKDGNIYLLPFGAQVGKYTPSPEAPAGFWIQRRVLKAFNYPKIKTMDQYFKLIKDYRDQHKGEGLIGFTALTYNWRFFDLSNPPMHLAGGPNDGGVIVDMKTHQAHVYGNKDTTKRWLKTLNTLNQEGLFDKSALVNNYDQYLARITSGKVLGFFDYHWQVGTALNNLKKAGNDDLRYVCLPIVYNKDIKDQYLDPPSLGTNRGVGITKSAKDPVRIIKFFNTMLEKKNQILIHWGIKGKTYEVDNNGKFYMNKKEIQQLNDNQFQQDFGFSYFNWYWPQWTTSSTLPDGNALAPGNQPSVAQAQYTPGDKVILKKYGVQTFSQMFSKPDKRPWYPAWALTVKQGSPASIFSTKSQDLEKKWFPKLILDKPANFDADWNTYVKKYNALNPSVYEKTETQLIKQKIKQVTGSEG